uniref:Uncharacterized protein n=1 Tax=Arundo donax TaxID=35708 RepID=A0A0A9BSN6_ARUDO
MNIYPCGSPQLIHFRRAAEQESIRHLSVPDPFVSPGHPIENSQCTGHQLLCDLLIVCPLDYFWRLQNVCL